MTRARNQLISLETTPYYHTISRCVRRAFLCGEDSLTGNNYEHRKQWVITRLRELSEVFAIDICAYTIMSNHYHLVLRVNQEQASSWTKTQVADRWGKLFSLPQLVARYLRSETSEAEANKAEEIITEWQERLTDVSWFMRALNEYLARKANVEDHCKDRFWEGRFKSQALLDEAAVLTCMSYVDLNPVRAGIAETPEASDFTSIQQRIHQHSNRSQLNTPAQDKTQTLPLMPLVKQHKDPHCNAIGFTLKDYLQLVDWAGRAVREGKRGAVSEDAPPILQRIGLEPGRFLEHLQGHAATEDQTAMGQLQRIRQAAEALGRRFLKGGGEARRLYVTASAG